MGLVRYMLLTTLPVSAKATLQLASASGCIRETVSTKAFTCQMVALYLFAMYLGQLRGKVDETHAKKLAQDLAELPLKRQEQFLADLETVAEACGEMAREG